MSHYNVSWVFLCSLVLGFYLVLFKGSVYIAFPEFLCIPTSFVSVCDLISGLLSALCLASCSTSVFSSLFLIACLVFIFSGSSCTYLFVFLVRGCYILSLTYCSYHASPVLPCLVSFLSNSDSVFSYSPFYFVCLLFCVHCFSLLPLSHSS